MGRFAKYAGTIEVTVDGEQWKMKPTISTSAGFLGGDENTLKTPEGLSRMLGALVDMFLKANPSEDGVSPEEHKSNIEAFVAKNFDTVIEQLVVKMGWIDEKDFKEKLKKTKKGPQKAETPSG